LKMWFYIEVLDLFKSSQVCPWFTENSLERIRSLQLGPRALGGGGSGRIPAAGTAGVWGKMWGRSCGSLTTRLWPKKEAGRLRRAWTAVQGGSVRCGFQTGKLGGNARRLVPRRDGLRVVSGLGKPVERRPRRGAALASVALLGRELEHA
jgi:hypothetical protein